MPEKLKFSLLYVEDDSILLDAYTDFLSEYFIIYKASSGAEGLELYKKYKPDIIITDINMPNMNGLELIREIRKNDSETICIISSAYSDEERLLQATDLFLTKYIVKPMTYSDILEILESVQANLIKRQSSIKDLNGKYSWDNSTLKLFRDAQEEIELRGKEMTLVSIFANNQNKVYTSEELMELIWREDDIKDTGKLRALISSFHKKLGEELFVSSYKVGYRIKTE